LVTMICIVSELLEELGLYLLLRLTMVVESGLLLFTLIDCDLARSNCHLEVLMDDMVFPSYSSSKVRTKHHEFNESKLSGMDYDHRLLTELAGNAMIRELDMSQITLRLLESVNKQGQGAEEHAIAKLTGPTLSTLQRALVSVTSPLKTRSQLNAYSILLLN
jgi:Ca2+-dependent lipid-binding protein